MVDDFLVEIGCEELPPKALNSLANALAEGIKIGLKEAKLAFSEIKPLASPRRLAVIVDSLQGIQQDIATTKRGPAISAAFDGAGNPSKAAMGFARSCGVEFSQLGQEKTDKGEYLVHHATQKGRLVEQIMPEIVARAVNQVPIPKPMRWGDEVVEFVRPVHWVVMLYGEKVIETELLGVKTCNQSHGHRFHHPGAVTICHAKEYVSQLQKANVIVDIKTRQAVIKNQVLAKAKQLKAAVVMPDELLDEVSAIVEWPQALLAHFDEQFLKVPKEALIAAMQQHQKSFALKGPKGELLPYFIFVANIESQLPKQVILGNEKVMRARLADAAFFYEQDNKAGLDSLIDESKKVIFQQKLGSLYEKTERVQHIGQSIAKQLNLDVANVHRASTLAKCDLMTGMVGEFPTLQGTMGFYYALNQGEDEQVALALKEQYMPRFSGDELPLSDIGCVLSLAERLDTLIGIFGIGQKPSGVKDPFKLRRHALAIIRILIGKGYCLDLMELLTLAQEGYGDKIENVIDMAHQFILERMNVWYQSQGVSFDVVNAVVARQKTMLNDFDQRIKAVNAFLGLKDAKALAQANKRVSKILAKEKIHLDGFFDNGLLEEDAEKKLADLLLTMEQGLKQLVDEKNYQELLRQLATLRIPVDAFFDSVMVMVEDESIRTNRLKLLVRLRQLFLNVADISLLQ
jgi:glycyl-tRNA synthetase beta chain